MPSFAEFVTLYWNKKRRSGALWTPQGIADDSGMSLNDVQAFLNYCHDRATLSDAELIATNPTITVTPFGTIILRETPAPAPLLDRTLDKVTLRELLAALSDLK